MTTLAPTHTRRQTEFHPNHVHVICTHKFKRSSHMYGTISYERKSWSKQVSAHVF